MGIMIMPLIFAVETVAIFLYGHTQIKYCSGQFGIAGYAQGGTR